MIYIILNTEIPNNICSQFQQKIKHFNKFNKSKIDVVYIPNNKFKLIRYLNILNTKLTNIDEIWLFVNPNKQDYMLGSDILGVNKYIKLINTCSTGTNHIDLKYCKNNNINVLSLKGDLDLIKSLPSTAELALGLILSLIRYIPISFNDVLNGEWDYTKFVGHQLDGLTLGIIGYGRLGNFIENYAKGLNMDVIVYDPYKIYYKGYQCKDIGNLIHKSDIITLHVHPKYDTINMINKKVILNNKVDGKDLYIVNTSRGEIVNEKDIVWLLKNKIITGYGTDVLIDEYNLNGINNSPIIKLYKEQPDINIVITPHIGGMTIEGQNKAYNWSLQKFLNILNGRYGIN